MKIRHLSLAVLLLSSAPLYAGHKPQPMYKAAEISIISGKSNEAVKMAIHDTLLRRRYFIEKEEAGSTLARVDSRNVWAEIRIVYNAKSAQIEYVNSEGLHYAKKDGVESIHPTYNRWIQTLERDLSLELHR